VLAFVGGWGAAKTWSISPWLALLPGLVAGLGVLLATLKRRVVVDRAAGTIVVEQRAFGIGTQTRVPLFHIRAVVIVARAERFGDVFNMLPGSSRFVAYLDRRVGEVVYLDESRRCAALLKLAEAIADVAEVRLEYEAPPQNGSQIN
jgi:hypothetical protein